MGPETRSSLALCHPTSQTQPTVQTVLCLLASSCAAKGLYCSILTPQDASASCRDIFGYLHPSLLLHPLPQVPGNKNTEVPTPPSLRVSWTRASLSYPARTLSPPHLASSFASLVLLTVHLSLALPGDTPAKQSSRRQRPSPGPGEAPPPPQQSGGLTTSPRVTLLAEADLTFCV